MWFLNSIGDMGEKGAKIKNLAMGDQKYKKVYTGVVPENDVEGTLKRAPVVKVGDVRRGPQVVGRLKIRRT